VTSAILAVLPILGCALGVYLSWRSVIGGNEKEILMNLTASGPALSYNFISTLFHWGHATNAYFLITLFVLISGAVIMVLLLTYYAKQRYDSLYNISGAGIKIFI
jgi:hypothetical protein